MPSTIRFHELAKLSADAYEALLRRTEAVLTAYLQQVAPIIERVRQDGDEALAAFARKFDHCDLAAADLKVTTADFDRAADSLDPDLTAAIEYASDNIRHFHRRTRPEPMQIVEVRPGVFAGERTTPIDSVACYVPRGKGSFPSVVLMTTIPATVAKVPRAIVITPPGPDGRVDAATLVAAQMAGVQEVYKCGGAHGVAAVAYGTRTVPKVHKIVGPGSPWVVAAKRLLADRIDPGIPAGPSEAIILADDTLDPRLAALDLLIESEHGPDSSAYLVTADRALAEAVMAAVPEYWRRLSPQRAEFSSTVLSGLHGGIVLAPNMDAAVTFVNDYAPEHLEILSTEPFAYLSRIVHAGEILLGAHTPISIGNFVLGPNAVLPTSGMARTCSPLSVHDFVKRSSYGYVTAAAYSGLSGPAGTLAAYEGFDAHALAVSDLRDSILNSEK